MISVELVNKENLKVVLAKKRNKKFFIKSTLEENLNFLEKKKDFILTFSAQEFEIHTIFLPQLKDIKTKELLSRNRLNLRNKDDILQIIENPEIKQNGQIQHFVYILPKNEIPDVELEKAQIITPSQVSVFNLSKLVSEKLYIYHCYSDEDKLILTVSKGNTLIYTRFIHIPDTEKENPINFLYENINLTYHYILQNKTKQIDLILLTGKLINFEELNGLVYNFSKIPVASIYWKNRFEGIENEEFHNYAIPIGALLTEEAYNFLPVFFKKKRAFDKLVNYLKVAVLAGIIVTVGSGYYKILNIENNINQIHLINTQIIKEQESILRSINFNLDDLQYFENYIMEKQNSIQTHPYYILTELKNILSITGLEEVSYKKPENAGYVVISIKSKKKFNSFSDFNAYTEIYKKTIEGIKENFDINDKSKFNAQNLEANIELELFKNVM